MAFLGLDLGTTGCKAVICDETGKMLAKAYREYKAVRNNEKQVIDAAEMWNSIQYVISESVKKTTEKVRAIAVSSFGEAFACLDENDNPLCEIMLATDQRGDKECEDLASRISSERVQSIAGAEIHRMYSVSKIMWYKNNMPESYKKTKRILFMADYATYMLCGDSVVDCALAARSILLDVHKKEWSSEIFDAAGLDMSMFSRPACAGEPVAKVRPEIARSLGLDPETLVVNGAHDQICAAIGAGALSAGVAVNGTGTVECVTPVFEKPESTELMGKYKYALVPHAVEGLYVSYAFSYTGGAMLTWFRNTFAKYEAEMAAKNGENIYALLDSAISETPSGILVLPHFSGAATPYMDTQATGTMMGLTIGTQSIDIYRAIMEGVVYEMFNNLECLEKAGIHTDELRATGGGAYSAPWLQMKADITGRKIISYKNCEAGTMGCIALCAKAVGDFKTLEDAVKVYSQSGVTYYRNDRYVDRYLELYDRYKKLYNATKEIMQG